MAFWDIVNKIIYKADLIIEVLDARFCDMSRNSEIENKVLSKKKLLFVVNKVDLIKKEEAEKIKKSLEKIAPCVFISAKKHLGTTFLRKKIMQLSKGNEVKVGVIGYPNTGKSSLINALKGNEAAKTSSQSGYTKKEQNVRVSKKIVLIDTPGVYSYDKKEPEELFIFGAIDYTKLKDPELAAYKLIEMFKEEICKKYKVENKDVETMLEEIAIKTNKLSKGNIPNTKNAAIQILRDWQKNDTL